MHIRDKEEIGASLAGTAALRENPAPIASPIATTKPTIINSAGIVMLDLSASGTSFAIVARFSSPVIDINVQTDKAMAIPKATHDTFNKLVPAWNFSAKVIVSPIMPVERVMICLVVSAADSVPVLDILFTPRRSASMDRAEPWRARRFSHR